jgi:hypothetical protein
VFTADGYYPTGDLGHLDADGFMFYHGRSDDMFKVSGATVYPSEVEQALRSIDWRPERFRHRDDRGGGRHGDRDGPAIGSETPRRKLLSSFSGSGRSETDRATARPYVHSPSAEPDKSSESGGRTQADADHPDWRLRVFFAPSRVVTDAGQALDLQIR